MTQRSNKIKFKEAFDKLAKYYDQDSLQGSLGIEYLSLIETTFIKDNLSKKGAIRRKQFIDLGMGTGRNIEIVLRKGFNVIGVDFSIQMIRQSEKKLKSFIKKKRLKLLLLDLNDALPFKDKSFDGAICIRVIKYLQRWKNLIQGVGKILKPGATFLLEFPNFYSVQSLSRFYNGYQTFKPSEIDYILGTSGFEVIYKKNGTILPYIVYKNLNSEKKLQIVLTFESILQKITNGFFARNFLYYCKKKDN